jgi:DNA-binding Lrp family transcriptional regulator
MWWGSSDPRLSIREMARRLHIDPTTAWNRLKAWRREGFLLGYSVVPNPGLFGARLAGGAVRIDDPRSKPAFFRDFGFVEGAAFAVDQVGPWVVVMFVFQTERGLRRSEAMTRRLSGVSEIEPCIPFRSPTTTVDPSPLDWRILATVHDQPESEIVRWSRTVGVTPKTFSRRFESLSKDCAVWSIPRLDFTRFRGATVARFVVRLRPAAKSERLLEKMRATFPTFILLEDQSALPELEGPGIKLLALLLRLESPGEVEDAEREIRRSDEVEAVEVYFPRRIYVYDDWFREHLTERGKAR